MVYDPQEQNDTILNYYYFQMTKHDATNRLPASQAHEKALKEGKSCWSIERQKKLWKLFLCLFACFCWVRCNNKFKLFFMSSLESPLNSLRRAKTAF